MKFYRAAPLSTIPAGQGTSDDSGLTGADAGGPRGAARVIAIRVADLMSPARRHPAGGDRTALVVAGTPQIRTGDQLVFVKVVAVAPAVVRRDGRVQAGDDGRDNAPRERSDGADAGR